MKKTERVATVANVHRVPAKKWNVWSVTARFVFNQLYEQMIDNQRLFLHPQQEALTPRKWSTVAWNASWLAADAVDEAHIEITLKAA